MADQNTTNNTTNENTTTDKTQAPEAKVEGKWARRAKTTAKWLGIGLGFGAVGAGAVLGFQHFRK